MSLFNYNKNNKIVILCESVKFLNLINQKLRLDFKVFFITELTTVQDYLLSDFQA
jgi:hypothetical protein